MPTIDRNNLSLRSIIVLLIHFLNAAPFHLLENTASNVFKKRIFR